MSFVEDDFSYLTEEEWYECQRQPNETRLEKIHSFLATVLFNFHLPYEWLDKIFGEDSHIEIELW